MPATLYRMLGDVEPALVVQVLELASDAIDAERGRGKRGSQRPVAAGTYPLVQISLKDYLNSQV